MTALTLLWRQKRMGGKRKIRLIVDFEGYNCSKFIIKEIAFINTKTNSCRNYFLKTYKLNNSTYFWLLKYYHHIPYWYGECRFSKVKNILNNKQFEFLVKDNIKYEILKKLTNNRVTVLNNCPSFFNLTKSNNFCDFHRSDCNKHCAVNKVSRIAYWYGSSK